jgi:iron only hydrogenase large subunit-like protein
VRIDVESDGTYSEINEDGSKSKLKATKISLTDCLACRCVHAKPLACFAVLGAVASGSTSRTKLERAKNFSDRIGFFQLIFGNGILFCAF